MESFIIKYINLLKNSFVFIVFGLILLTLINFAYINYFYGKINNNNKVSYKYDFISYDLKNSINTYLSSLNEENSLYNKSLTESANVCTRPIGFEKVFMKKLIIYQIIDSKYSCETKISIDLKYKEIFEKEIKYLQSTLLNKILFIFQSDNDFILSETKTCIEDFLCISVEIKNSKMDEDKEKKLIFDRLNAIILSSYNSSYQRLINILSNENKDSINMVDLKVTDLFNYFRGTIDLYANTLKVDTSDDISNPMTVKEYEILDSFTDEDINKIYLINKLVSAKNKFIQNTKTLFDNKKSLKYDYLLLKKGNKNISIFKTLFLDLNLIFLNLILILMLIFVFAILNLNKK